MLSRSFLALVILFPVLIQAAPLFQLDVLEIPDVQRGAGLAVIMKFPSGHTWLYDTGAGYPSRVAGDGWEGNSNTGRDRIAPLLKERGLAKIDGILMSHAHYDHFGGLMWLEGNFPVSRLIDSGFSFIDEANPAYAGELGQYEKLRDLFKGRKAYQAAQAGATLDIDPQLKIEVIAPPSTFFPDRKASTRQAHDSPAHYLVNANSLGLRIQYGDVVFYLPGDIQTEDIELSLLPFVDKSKIKCDVLIAPGHGIHCTKEFAEATKPKVSIASVFPRYAKGLKSTPMLQAVGAKTYITGLHGDIQVVCDGKNFTVRTHRSPLASSSVQTSK